VNANNNGITLQESFDDDGSLNSIVTTKSMKSISRGRSITIGNKSKTDIDLNIVRSSAIPGPGHYELKDESQPKGGVLSPTSSISQIELLMNRAKEVPGPGAYGNNSLKLNDRNDQKGNNSSSSRSGIGFGGVGQGVAGGKFNSSFAKSEIERLCALAEKSPAPGHYNPLKPFKYEIVPPSPQRNQSKPNTPHTGVSSNGFFREGSSPMSSPMSRSQKNNQHLHQNPGNKTHQPFTKPIEHYGNISSAASHSNSSATPSIVNDTAAPVDGEDILPTLPPVRRLSKVVKSIMAINRMKSFAKVVAQRRMIEDIDTNIKTLRQQHSFSESEDGLSPKGSLDNINATFFGAN